LKRKHFAWDDNPDSREAAQAQGVPIKNLKQVDWSEIDDFVLSPGVPHHLPKPHWAAKLAKEAGVPIICDIEILAREVAAKPESARPKIIAITGTVPMRLFFSTCLLTIWIDTVHWKIMVWQSRLYSPIKPKKMR